MARNTKSSNSPLVPVSTKILNNASNTSGRNCCQLIATSRWTLRISISETNVNFRRISFILNLLSSVARLGISCFQCNNECKVLSSVNLVEQRNESTHKIGSEITGAAVSSTKYVANCCSNVVPGSIRRIFNLCSPSRTKCPSVEILSAASAIGGSCSATGTSVCCGERMVVNLNTSNARGATSSEIQILNFSSQRRSCVFPTA